MNTRTFQQSAQNAGGTRLRLFCITLVIISLSSWLYGQAEPPQLMSFQGFMTSTYTAVADDYMARPGSHVQGTVAFEDMRQHILNLYQGVEVNHSFLLDGHAFDCIPVEQQAALRLNGQNTIAMPPSDVQLPKRSSGDDSRASQIDSSHPLDALGNSTRCEDNSIPMRRVTLEDITQFETLRDFFAKDRDGSGRAPKPGDSDIHHYATAYKYVNNLGGNSDLNVWRPYVNTKVGDAMSLSQEWYSGGDPLQTAEVGWQVQPQAWGTENSVLFIYYTADDYNNTGCYNLECGAFVQVKNDWYFGDGFTNYSKAGGTQYYFDAAFYLYQGNWWLSLGGEWVGYYIGSIYGKGEMRHHATQIQFGGEVAGKGHWPPMGSGRWPSKGYEYAASQSDIWFFNTNKGKVWPKLTIYEDSPQCYKVGGLTYAPTSFYFGGPGGGGC